jgi:hypothetical protein
VLDPEINEAKDYSMSELMKYTFRLQTAVLAMGTTLLLSYGASFAKEAGEEYVPSLLSPAATANQSLLNRRLRSARNDMDAFSVFAENFRKSGDAKALAQLQEPVDAFLKKHVDVILSQDPEQSNIETTRLTAEILFIKARLFIDLNRRSAAQTTIADMKRRFSEYRKIMLELPEERTTLDRAVGMLDEELAHAAATEKK